MVRAVDESWTAITLCQMQTLDMLKQAEQPRLVII